MTTQKFMGKDQLIKRLTAQVGNKPEAVAILKKRGDLKADGKTFTDKGQKRNKMTAEQRAKDRASKKSGKATKEYAYNPKINTAKLKD